MTLRQLFEALQTGMNNRTIKPEEIEARLPEGWKLDELSMLKVAEESQVFNMLEGLVMRRINGLTRRQL